MKPIYAADHFSGAGGWTTGLMRAAKRMGRDVDLIAVNHWSVAIDSHRVNHPHARHFCQNLDNVDPRVVVPGGYLDLLIASPECVFHSNARGDKPIDDQRRTSAWNVPRWAELIKIRKIVIENVTEFEDWGPVDENNHKIKARAGETFKAFIAAIRSLGYEVEYRKIVAANYGDATTRERLFIQAQKSGPITWPMPTHAAPSDAAPALRRWNVAEDVIDLSDKGISIYNRPKPLAKASLGRIKMGMERYDGKPFVIKYYRTGIAKPLTEPLDTLTTKDRFGLVQPTRHGDILLRMLRTREMALAMGFGDKYVFLGNRKDQIKQVGNAVPCGTAQAMCETILSN